MLQPLKDLPLVLCVMLAAHLHWQLLHRVLQAAQGGWRRLLARILGLCVTLWMGAAALLDHAHFGKWVSYPFFSGWAPQLGAAWAYATVCGLLIWIVLALLIRKGGWQGVYPSLPPRQAAHPSREIPGGPRRALLKLAGSAAAAIPFGALGYGTFIERRQFYLQEVSIGLPGLPQEFDGFRMVQLSDIHLSPLLKVQALDYVIGMANETNADLGLITGDLITSRPDQIGMCVRHLSQLRTNLGMLGCNGNHEWYAEAEGFTKRYAARFGLDILRHETRRIRRGTAELNFAGVDHQWSNEAYLKGVETLLAANTTNILLSHNPDVFPVAARQGWDLTISGHTHGGQVTMEVLRTSITPVRLMTPYIWGLYRQNNKSIYVTRGIGTVGVPMRIGAPPEVTLITLCAI